MSQKLTKILIQLQQYQEQKSQLAEQVEDVDVLTESDDEERKLEGNPKDWLRKEKNIRGELVDDWILADLTRKTQVTA